MTPQYLVEKQQNSETIFELCPSRCPTSVLRIITDVTFLGGLAIYYNIISERAEMSVIEKFSMES